LAANPSEQAHALWYVAPGRAEIRPEAAASPVAGEVQVRALYGAVSRGTERLVFFGRVPEREHERMRAPLMAGAFPFPVKYGYINVGRVERARPSWSAAPSSRCTHTRTFSPFRLTRFCPFPTRCRHNGRCWRRTWRRR